MKCVLPEKLKEYDFEVLIVAVYWQQYREQVMEQIHRLGLEKHEIIMAEECTPPMFDNKNYSKGRVDYTDDYNNRVIVEDNVPIGNIVIYFQGTDNRIKIESGVIISDKLELVCIGHGNRFHIEEKTSVMSMHCEVSEQAEIHIGKDCMFSWGVQLIQHPAHPIYNIDTGKRVNVSKTIQIGNHVWIGKEVVLLNGFSIGDDSVVGYASVSSGKFGKHCIIAGNPAKVIREGVCWKRDVVGYYPLDSI